MFEEATTSVTKGEPIIESQNSMAMESDSSVGNASENKLSDGSAENSIAMESNSNIENREVQDNQNDIEINTLASDDVKKETTTAATAALLEVQKLKRKQAKQLLLQILRTVRKAKHKNQLLWICLKAIVHQKMVHLIFNQKEPPTTDSYQYDLF